MTPTVACAQASLHRHRAELRRHGHRGRRQPALRPGERPSRPHMTPVLHKSRHSMTWLLSVLRYDQAGLYLHLKPDVEFARNFELIPSQDLNLNPNPKPGPDPSPGARLTLYHRFSPFNQPAFSFSSFASCTQRQPISGVHTSVLFTRPGWCVGGGARQDGRRHGTHRAQPGSPSGTVHG